MTANAVISKLGAAEYPWRWGLRIRSAESDVFEAVVAALKQNIPARERRWDGNGKRWLFKDNWIEVAADILRVHRLIVDHDDAPGEDARAPVSAPPSRVLAAYERLHLLPSAPPEVVAAAYRALAKRTHPDRGGDTTVMQQLNAAYALIRGER